MTEKARQIRTRRLADAAAKRASDTEARARRAIMRLRSEGDPVTFRSVATTGAVSESYLYAHAQLSSEIRRHASHTRTRPATDPSSAESLRTKHTVAMNRVRELETRIAQLEGENALLRGEIVDLRRKSQRSAPRQ